MLSTLKQALRDHAFVRRLKWAKEWIPPDGFYCHVSSDPEMLLIEITLVPPMEDAELACLPCRCGKVRIEEPASRREIHRALDQAVGMLGDGETLAKGHCVGSC